MTIYQQPATQVVVQNGATGSGLGNAALVLGILAIVFSWFTWIGLPCSILAVIFGALGMHKFRQGQASSQGSAVAGLIMGILGLIFSVAIVAFIAMFVNEVNKVINS